MEEIVDCTGLVGSASQMGDAVEVHEEGIGTE